MNGQSVQRSEAHEDGLPVPRRYWSAAGIWLALAMAVLDGAIANVALPVIARQLGASPAASVWIINAYQLTITMLLLPLAALGDRLGYKRIYIPGLALFTLGSIGCALGGTLSLLIAARVFQGVGAACIMSMNAALVRATYPARLLGRGIGYNAMVLSVSAATGPTLASLILSVASWQWLFLINLPIGIAALIVGHRALPDPHGHHRPFDWAAAGLSAAMMGLVIFGAETSARESSALGLAMIGGGALAGAVLVRREWRKPAPLVPLDLLRIPIFTLSILTSIVSFAAQMLAYVAIPFLLQSALGRSVFATGLLMTPWPLAVGVSAPLAGRLADRVNAGLLGGIGLAVFAAGLFFLSQLGPDTSNLDIVWRMALCGLGFGFYQSPQQPDHRQCGAQITVRRGRRNARDRAAPWPDRRCGRRRRGFPSGRPPSDPNAAVHRVDCGGDRRRDQPSPAQRGAAEAGRSLQADPRLAVGIGCFAKLAARA